MTDTPEHIQDLQLKIWMAKSPGERLFQALKNNEELFLFFKHAREAMQKTKQQLSEETKM
jgi:hypothetical protein